MDPVEAVSIECTHDGEKPSTWLHFNPVGGPAGKICLEVLADRAGGVTRRAILTWVEQYREHHAPASQAVSSRR